jgi:diguanylate cyclase (GGDEF)-like protein/PAS domain S-box-containing protein
MPINTTRVGLLRLTSQQRNRVTISVEHRDDRDMASILLSALGSGGDPMLVIESVNGTATIAWCNRGLCDVAHAETDDLLGIAVSTLVATTSGEMPLSPVSVVEYPVVLSGHDGSLSAWDATAIPSVIGRFWVVRLTKPAIARDVSERLRASEARFRALADNAPVGIVSSTAGLRLGYVNQYLATLVGAPVDRLLGMGWMGFLAADEAAAVTVSLSEVIAGEPRDIGTRLVTADGEERWVTIRAVPVETPDRAAGFVATVEDVTDRRAFEQMMSWRADHDPLTGLRNRSSLTSDIESSLRAAGSTTRVGVLFLDLDRFKAVNDSYGHEAGDSVLNVVADRLRAAVRIGDSVFRFAGDEFVVVAHRVTSTTECERLAERLVAAVSQPTTIGGVEINISASIGFALSNDHPGAEELLRAADSAMFIDKRTRSSQR